MIKNIKDLHSKLRLSGNPPNALFGVNKELFSYLLSLLRNEAPILPSASIDEWKNLLSLLSSHGIIPLLYWKIGTLSKDLRPPQEIMDTLRQTFMFSMVRSLRAEKQIQEILAAFNHQGVQNLLLKGPAFGRFLYPDPATRPSSDLDILVTPEKYLAARKILEELDYKCKENIFNKLEELEVEEVFIHQKDPKNKKILELHWALHGFEKVFQHGKLNQYFQRSIKVEAPALSLTTLHPVDALIHCAIHMNIVHNKGIRLLWINDIALLAQKLAVPKEWEELKERSITIGARLAVEHALKMAKLWMGLKLPEEFADFRKWPTSTAAETSAWSHSILRHKSFVSWLKVRWPKNLGGIKNLRLLFYLFTNRLKRKFH